MPGQDQAIDVAFVPLTTAYGGNEDLSGVFFGNIVCRVMVDRDDEWYFKPAEQDGDRWIGVTYFRKQR